MTKFISFNIAYFASSTSILVAENWSYQPFTIIDCYYSIINQIGHAASLKYTVYIWANIVQRTLHENLLLTWPNVDILVKILLFSTTVSIATEDAIGDKKKKKLKYTKKNKLNKTSSVWWRNIWKLLMHNGGILVIFYKYSLKDYFILFRCTCECQTIILIEKTSGRYYLTTS